jgi:hypothetical protein
VTLGWVGGAFGATAVGRFAQALKMGVCGMDWAQAVSSSLGAAATAETNRSVD